MFFYEGRTIRGLGFVEWALVIQLAAVVATGVTLATLALVLGPALANPGSFLNEFFGIIAAVCGIQLGQVAMAVVFLVGFVDVHAGRHEYGLEHARSVDRATVCLAIFAALSLFSTAYTVSVNLFAATGQTVPVESFLTGNQVLAPLGALIAGIGLYFIARAIAEAGLLRRLQGAVLLGVAGAFAGPVLVEFATAANPHDVSAIVTGMLASAVAGNGMGALSLLVLVLIFRDLRRTLVTGRPAPTLPRYMPAYPWPWPGQAPPTAMPPGPVEPPKG